MFHTTYTKPSAPAAGPWHRGLSKLEMYKQNLVDQLARRFLDEAGEREIASLYPQFRPILDKWRSGREVTWISKGHDWGETPSIYRDFVHCILSVMAKNAEFGGRNIAMRCAHSAWMPRQNQSTMLNCNLSELVDGRQPEPWAVPRAADLQRLQKVSGVTTQDSHFYHGSVNHAWSAAAMAIRLLGAVPQTLRRHIRRIRLVEDRDSVAHPECHMRGFIPLCVEIPRLRVQRTVSLLRVVYPVNAPYP